MATLRTNVVANVVQTLVSSVLLFLLYRFVSRSVGIEAFGVWSLVMATVASARIAEFGIGSAVTKYVAAAEAKGAKAEVSEVIDSALAVSAIAVASVGLIGLLPAVRILTAVVGPGHAQVVADLAPFAVLSLWISCQNAVLTSALDGMKRMVERSALVVGGQGILLVLSYVFVPRYGIVGLGIAQVCQASVQAIATRLLVKAWTNSARFLPAHASWSAVKGMLFYGVNLQAQTVAQALLDPAAKFLLALFSGPASVGYFELASRVVQYGRSIIISANRAIVPYVAQFEALRNSAAKELYSKNIKIVLALTIPLFSVIAASTPFVAEIVLGHQSAEFNFMMLTLCIAWGVSTVGAPAYFMNMGSMFIWKNTISHGITSGASLLLGYIFGSVFATQGVVIGYCIGLIAGAAYLLASNSNGAMKPTSEVSLN